jgi:hypothetical protein
VALDAGDPARALAVLKGLPKRSWSYLDGAALATRARVALANGDVAEARKLLDDAVAIQPGLLDRVEHAQQLTTSRALRALVAAGQGERELAMAEAEALAASEAATPDALRIAAMARGLVFEREGRTEDLADLLRANGELLRRTSAPAERQLLHGWRRLIDAPKRAVYRKAHAFEEVPANPLETLPSGAFEGEAERPSNEPRFEGATAAPSFGSDGAGRWSQRSSQPSGSASSPPGREPAIRRPRGPLPCCSWSRSPSCSSAHSSTPSGRRANTRAAWSRRFAR